MHAGLGQHPPQRQPGERPPAGHRAQPLDDLQMSGEPRVGEVVVLAPPVVARQPRRPRAVEAAGEHAAVQGAGGQHGDAVAAAVGQKLLFRVAPQQAVGHLQRRHRGDGAQPVEVGHAGIAQAAGADQAALAQAGQLLPPLGELLRRARVMDLIEVDALGAQAPQALLQLVADAGGGEPREGARAPAHPRPAALGRDAHAVAIGASAERAADQLLGVAAAVERGGVQPVDAAVQGGVDGGQRVGVRLRPPAAAPAGPADRPGAQADAAGHRPKTVACAPLLAHPGGGVIRRP